MIPEERLHHAYPQGDRRREVYLAARMPFEPALDFGMFMCGVVVGDQMDLSVLRSRLIDQSQKPQPFLMPMALLAEAD